MKNSPNEQLKKGPLVVSWVYRGWNTWNTIQSWGDHNFIQIRIPYSTTSLVLWKVRFVFSWLKWSWDELLRHPSKEKGCRIQPWNPNRCRQLSMRSSFLRSELHSLKLTAKAPENGWLEFDKIPFGALFSGANLLFVSGRVHFSVVNRLGCV